MQKLVKVLGFTTLLLVSAAGWAGIDIGPAVGDKIPAPFTALDKSGAPKTYADLTGKNGTVLYFVRSAKWCPFCQNQLIDINGINDKLAARGYAMVALSYDAPDVLAAFAAQRKIAYPLLSDQKSAMIDAFGLRDPQYAPGHFAHGVPMPAIFVIDAGGVVRAKLAEEGYKVRPTTDALLETLDGLNKK